MPANTLVATVYAVPRYDPGRRRPIYRTRRADTFRWTRAGQRHRLVVLRSSLGESGGGFPKRAFMSLRAPGRDADDRDRQRSRTSRRPSACRVSTRLRWPTSGWPSGAAPRAWTLTDAPVV